MIRKKTYALVLAAMLWATSCFAQFSITGRVLNDEDLRPISLASVFLTGTSVGDKTTADGAFRLGSVKPGKYNLVVSVIGFVTYKKELMVDADIKLDDIDLQPKVTALKEVFIKPEKHRDYDLRLFEQEFLGSSDFAKDCTILNPDVLSLQYDDDADTLSGSSAGFLLIENRALGYTIKYQIDNFFADFKNMQKKLVSYNGSVWFEKMKGTPGQEERWQKRRRKVYANSTMHFLRAVLGDDLEKQGFQVLQLNANVNYKRPPDSVIAAKIKYYKKASRDNPALKDSLTDWQDKYAMPRLIKEYIPVPQQKKDIFKPSNLKGIFAIYASGHDNGLEIFYNSDHHFTLRYDDETSLISFNRPYAFFDYSGIFLNPRAVQITGAWAKNRVAELLPSDYEPEDATN